MLKIYNIEHLNLYKGEFEKKETVHDGINHNLKKKM